MTESAILLADSDYALAVWKNTAKIEPQSAIVPGWLKAMRRCTFFGFRLHLNKRHLFHKTCRSSYT